MAGVLHLNLGDIAAQKFASGKYDAEDSLEHSPATSVGSKSPRESLELYEPAGGSKSTEGESLKDSDAGSSRATGSASFAESAQSIDAAEQRRQTLEKALPHDPLRSRVRSISPMRIVAPVRDAVGNPLATSRGRLEPTSASAIRKASASPVLDKAQRVVSPNRMVLGKLLSKSVTITPNASAQRTSSPCPARACISEASPMRACMRTASPIKNCMRVPSPVPTVAAQRAASPSPVRTCVRMSSPVRPFTRNDSAVVMDGRQPSPAGFWNYRQASPSPVRSFSLLPLTSRLVASASATGTSSFSCAQANAGQVSTECASMPYGCSPVTVPCLMSSSCQAPAAPMTSRFLLGPTQSSKPMQQPRDLSCMASSCVPSRRSMAYLSTSDSCFAKDFD